MNGLIANRIMPFGFAFIASNICAMYAAIHRTSRAALRAQQNRTASGALTHRAMTTTRSVRSKCQPASVSARARRQCHTSQSNRSLCFSITAPSRPMRSCPISPTVSISLDFCHRGNLRRTKTRAGRVIRIKCSPL